MKLLLMTYFRKCILDRCPVMTREKIHKIEEKSTYTQQMSNRQHVAVKLLTTDRKKSIT